MTAVELRNFWKKINVLKKGYLGYLRLSDFWELLDLTEEQKKLRRVDIKEIIGLARDKQ